MVRNGYLPTRTITTGIGEVTVDFSEALSALLGPEAKGLSAGTISRLKAKWNAEHQDWQDRSLKHKRYVSIWADGIYFNIRDDERQCILVIIGVTDAGHKELLFKHLADVIEGVQFKDGIRSKEETKASTDQAKQKVA